MGVLRSSLSLSDVDDDHVMDQNINGDLHQTFD